MKRNRKYNKKMAMETSMNGLRHIVILLWIGFFSSVLFSQDCADGMDYMEYLNSDESICVPTDFSTTNQSQFQAFYYFNSVTINGAPIASDDWVGAFNGDICVGARQWDTDLCLSGVCDVPVMGYDAEHPDLEYTMGYMNSGDIPTFKIYDTSKDTYYDAASSEDIPGWANNTIFPSNSLNVVTGPGWSYDQ